MKSGAGTTSQANVEMLVTLPLAEQPPLVICVYQPPPHIRVLWGPQFVIPYLYCLTPEDGKVISLYRDIHDAQIPVSVEVPSQWL